MILIEAAGATNSSSGSHNAPDQMRRSAMPSCIGVQMIHHALGTFVGLVGVGISVAMGLLWKGDKGKSNVTEAFLLGMILVALGAIFDRLSDISYMLVGN